jgi:hypothetical protein
MIKNLCFSHSVSRKDLQSSPPSDNFTKTPLNFEEIIFSQNISQVSLKELKWREFFPPH